ncbi:DUF6221 family protein [Streptomyces lavendofoliae]|uniref:Uncharacterized protein n=1 Tax=Streptomyces lavendofoliae TaxID=67314 RepID=A0A918I128_9ACTN|nr:DUF6221 family protein [Streptomyces lavendofoliae]GGU54716.1 hypothetical protein GCM10010274_49530 [Streptomyces lavendofoliae]
MELVDFLRARLDEDADTASAASPGPWHVNAESDEVLAVDDIAVADGFALSGQQLRATTAHIARHNPARILAEVDAKRQMVDDYARNAAAAEAEQCPNEWNGGIDKLGYFVLPLLALPYADHPDYRDEWRP